MLGRVFQFPSEEYSVSLFWKNAAKLMEAGLDAMHAGRASDAMTVVIGAEGGIHLLAHNDWPLDRLAADRGAKAVYRVKRSHGQLAVEGREGASRCYLETECPSNPALALIRDKPMYTLTTAPRPAGILPPLPAESD